MTYRADAFMTPWGVTTLDHELALRGLFMLVSVLDPFSHGEPGVPSNRELAMNTVRYVQRRVDARERWATALWRIDGVELNARFARFAGGWAGYMTELGPVGVVVVAKGTSPHGVNLLRVTDQGRRYHVDLGTSIEYPSTAERARRLALGRVADQPHVPVRMHADWRRLAPPGAGSSTSAGTTRS
jgi:hypothetical protein